MDYVKFHHLPHSISTRQMAASQHAISPFIICHLLVFAVSVNGTCWGWPHILSLLPLRCRVAEYYDHMGSNFPFYSDNDKFLSDLSPDLRRVIQVREKC